MVRSRVALAAFGLAVLAGAVIGLAVLVGYGLFAVAVGSERHGAVGTVAVEAAQFALAAGPTFGIASVAGGAVGESRSRPE